MYETLPNRIAVKNTVPIKDAVDMAKDEDTKSVMCANPLFKMDILVLGSIITFFKRYEINLQYERMPKVAPNESIRLLENSE